jgi:hypothetical protein
VTDALRELLAEIDVDADTLRRDPEGRTWLPAQAQAWVRDDPECAAMLARFVEGERELFGDAGLRSNPSTDPFFTARVLDALPAPLSFTGLTPRERAAVLAVFHVIAGVVAYAIAAVFAPEAVSSLADQAHDMVGDASALGVDASAPWLTAFVLGIVALVAFVSSRSHTSAT